MIMSERLFRSVQIMLILVTSAVFASSCIFEKDPTDEEYEISTGETIPDFTVTMNDGTVVTGAELRKGKCLIMFFHTDCPDCQGTLPSVQKIYDEYLKKGVKFALISRSQLAEPIEEYWSQMGYTMPYSPQPTREVYALFASSRVPRVYVCKDGKVVSFYRDDPIPTYEQLKADIESLF